MTYRRARHFEGLADKYTTARPPYPAALWRNVVETGLVGPGRRALDLGAGTGQVTEVLLRHGMDVIAVEPGDRLAAIIEERFPGAAVVRARAEDIQPASDSFDIAAIATAFHWMDPGTVLPMVHRALHVDGRLLVWRNVFGDPAAEMTPSRYEVRRIVARRDPARTNRTYDAKATADLILHSGLFEVERICRYRWAINLNTKQVRSLFGTFSDWPSTDVAEAASIVDDLGGCVTEHYSSWLVAAAPVPYRRFS